MPAIVVFLFCMIVSAAHGEILFDLPLQKPFKQSIEADGPAHFRDVEQLDEWQVDGAVDEGSPLHAELVCRSLTGDEQSDEDLALVMMLRDGNVMRLKRIVDVEAGRYRLSGNCRGNDSLVISLLFSRDVGIRSHPIKAEIHSETGKPREKPPESAIYREWEHPCRPQVWDSFEIEFSVSEPTPLTFLFALSGQKNELMLANVSFQRVNDGE